MVSVLSVDAWADDEGWTWNSWHKIGECPIGEIPTIETALQWLIDAGFASKQAQEFGAIEDDGYNLTLVDNTDGYRPILAIAYGEIR